MSLNGRNAIVPFCAYLNGFHSWKPDVESYYHEHDDIPHGLKHIDNSGAVLTDEYKLYPRDDSDMFDKTKMIIIDGEIKDELSFLCNRIVCDVCLFRLYHNGSIVVTEELDANEKLFRMFMRNNKG